MRLAAPETRRTALRRTPNVPATAASAASVALPSTARALTATTRAPACSPVDTWPFRAGLHPDSDPYATSIDICLSRPASTSGPNAGPDPPDRYPPFGAAIALRVTIGSGAPNGAIGVAGMVWS